MGAGFSTMQTKWKVFGVIGIIAVVLFGIQLVGLLITAAVIGAAAAGATVGSSKGTGHGKKD